MCILPNPGVEGNGAVGKLALNGVPTTFWQSRLSSAPSETGSDEAVAQVAEWLRTLVAEDQVVELRALKAEYCGRRVTMSGFFDARHLEHMAREAIQLSVGRDAEG